MQHRPSVTRYWGFATSATRLSCTSSCRSYRWTSATGARFGVRRRSVCSEQSQTYDREWISLACFEAIFGELVLGCINANVCNQMLILQHFSRFTRFPILSTSRNWNFQKNIACIWLSNFFAILSKILQKLRFFKVFHRILHRFWSKFHGISPNILDNDERSTKLLNF